MNFAVIGAGNGGQCIAGYLSMLGYSVKQQDKNGELIKSLQEKGRIKLKGKVVGEASLDLVTTDVHQVIEDTDIIMVVTTADAHMEVAQEIAPFLQKNQIVILNPGHTGGALEFLHTIIQHGCLNIPVIAETQDLLFSCRAVSVGEVNVSGIKRVMDIASIPSEKASEVVDLFKDIFPQFRARPNVLYTSLNNLGAMVHPVPTLLNAGRIESQQSFDYYSEGITKGIANVMEQMDEERLSIGKALGVDLTSILQWQYEAYGIEADSIYEALTCNESYIGIKAPKTLDSRFLTEDVPCGLVPLVNIGRLLGIEMPVTQSFIETANSLLRKDYRKEGRNLEKLGIKNHLEELMHVIS
ncbi:NAD/NADP octopine/nopaline dehydrogenase family protein [Cytobacillus sp. FJAT-53684]|uniref:NAD/NADP octopine/nopaline dehydrogenase family protein n=1 Tax=Cytobacillus mangrovibacter TaxID=3299024 RepID=A0ABW6JX01_9BACI